MKRNYLTVSGGFHRMAFSIIVICLVLFFTACNKKMVAQNIEVIQMLQNDSSHHWLDLNVLFSPSTTEAQRQQILSDMKNTVVQYLMTVNSSLGTYATSNIQYWSCPCDTLLYNFYASTPLWGSGVAASTPPPVIKKTPATGDAIQYINQNNAMVKDGVDSSLLLLYRYGTIHPFIKFPLQNSSIDTARILAVMDTGLDTALFQNDLRGLLWNDPTGQTTIRNFQFLNNFRPLDYFFDDDHTYKHGSAVTALALQAIETFPHLSSKPKIMVLKVLDSNRVGTTFTVSCALSYARQKHATVVNASLGYYDKDGMEDSVLRHYVELCHEPSPNVIPIISAAGNLPEPHSKPLCTISSVNDNELTIHNRFFPGCFNKELSNVLCVTSLPGPINPCFYQNFSQLYVDLGVIANPASTGHCCSFPIDFYRSEYEGSSFATPILSGKIMAYLLKMHSFDWQLAFDNIGATPTTRVSKNTINYVSP